MNEPLKVGAVFALWLGTKALRAAARPLYVASTVLDGGATRLSSLKRRVWEGTASRREFARCELCGAPCRPGTAADVCRACLDTYPRKVG